MKELSIPQHPQPLASQEFNRSLKVSLLAHAVLLLWVVLQSWVFPGKPKPYIPTLRVDLVGLPDVLKNDIQAPNHAQVHQDIAKVFKEAEQKAEQKAKAEKAHKKKEVARKDEMVLNPKEHKEAAREKRNKRALDRMKALAKVQDFSDDSRPSRSQLIKGNQVSPGSSLSGEAREASEAHYYDLLKDRLQENWALPSWIARQNFSAKVQILIDSRGKLKRLQFTKTSGNHQFDDAVKRAIQESQPFPIPPKDLASSLSSDGILVGFPL